LIDTPGFDDTYLNDTDILKLIADFLAATYQHGMFLTGIIFLQGINTNRVLGSEITRTRLFEKVCGSETFSNIVIATTMWSEIKSQDEGKSRMRERTSDPTFWGTMVDKGAQVVKHEDNSESARRIVQMVANKSIVKLQMQQELVQNNGKVVDTSAGKLLDAELDRTSARVQGNINDLKNERNTAEEIRELQARLEEIVRERQRLRDAKVSLIIS
jgi:hypothetical protein